MTQLIIQGIGYLALLFVILSFQKNTRTKILFYMLIGLVLFVIHYGLLNAWTGSFMNLIESAMVFVAYKKETTAWAKHKVWLYVFLSLFVITGLIASKTTTDFLPVIAQLFGTIAVWQTNTKAIRFIMLIPRPLWFIYNLVVGSYAGLTAEVFILISVLIGIVRFDILGKSRKVSKKQSNTL